MKNSRNLRLAVAIALVLGIVTLLRPVILYRLIPPLGRREVVKTVFQDQQIFDAMMNSPQVTAQRLHRKSDGEQVLLSDYNRDVPVTLTADQARQIKSLLKKPSSYLWFIRSCLPDYGELYNFQSGNQTVHVAFCLKCNIVGVFIGDNDASNAINFTSQFNPIRGQIVALSKALFPNDSEMQALK